MIIKSSEIKKNIFKYKCIILHGENLSLKKEIEDELLIDYKKMVIQQKYTAKKN